jgi:hypothetical protein
VKKGSLPISWIRWRHHRYRALVAQGLASHLAWDVAKGEAKGRHRISGLVGNTAARDAELECISVDGELRFVLVGDLGSLTDEQIATIDELNCRQKEAA